MSLNALQAYEQDNLCTSADMHQNISTIRILNTLGERQEKFCIKFTNKYASELARLARYGGTIDFVWTHKKIEIRRADGSKNLVQAVANTAFPS